MRDRRRRHLRLQSVGRIKENQWPAQPNPGFTPATQLPCVRTRPSPIAPNAKHHCAQLTSPNAASAADFCAASARVSTPTKFNNPSTLPEQQLNKVETGHESGLLVKPALRRPTMFYTLNFEYRGGLWRLQICNFRARFFCSRYGAEKLVARYRRRFCQMIPKEDLCH
jgi:hypothetical protein